MARKPLRPLIRSGGFYPSRKWTPLVYAGGYTTANGGEEPAPSPIEKTITGNPIHILDALAKLAQALSVKLEPVQDLNGYDSPWPAGGGKNVLPTPTEAQTVNGVTATPNADGSITLTGTASAIAYFDLITGFDSTAYAGYIVTGLPDDMASNSSTICYRISTASSRASLQDIQRGASGAYVSNTIVDNGTNLVFSLRVNNGYALPNGGLTLYPMMRASSASADFAPYSNICPISGHTDADVIVSPTLNKSDGTTYPIPLGQTVYGGTLDALTGVLTVDRAMVDLGTLAWSETTTSGSNKRVVSAGIENTAKRPSSSSVVANIICSNYKTVSANNVYNEISGISFTSSGYISAYDPNYQTGAAFKTAMSGVQLVYELATPQTIQLTAQQVELLLGENNIWSDGEMTLTYLADGNASDGLPTGVESC